MFSEMRSIKFFNVKHKVKNDFLIGEIMFCDDHNFFCSDFFSNVDDINFPSLKKSDRRNAN